MRIQLTRRGSLWVLRRTDGHNIIPLWWGNGADAKKLRAALQAPEPWGDEFELRAGGNVHGRLMVYLENGRTHLQLRAFGREAQQFTLRPTGAPPAPP